MNIGLLHIAPPESGGAYQYAENVIECLKTFDKVNEYTLFYAQEDYPYKHHEGANWKPVYLRNFEKNDRWWVKKTRSLLRLFSVFSGSRFVCGNYFPIKKYNLDILFCLFPSPVGSYCQLPYAAPIFDMMQNYYSQFKERSYWKRIRRNFQYKIMVKGARLIIADSPSGKADILKFYKIAEERVLIFPSLPLSLVKSRECSENFADKVMEKYSLPEQYIFYPAQLWQHKNHIGIVKALHLLKTKYGMKVNAVFAGSKKNAYSDIMKLVGKFNLNSQIRYLGYVPDEDIKVLYKKAMALVMPTFYGPANVPVWEAFALGCPVITSDVYGIADQVGGAGLLVDPRNPEDIADKIRRLYIDKDFRDELVRKGLARVKETDMEFFTKNLLNTFEKLFGG